jgi:PhnB protein
MASGPPINDDEHRLVDRFRSFRSPPEEVTMPNPIPEGYHSVTPYISCKDAGAAIDFYKRAFGAQELFRMPGPGGHGVMHAEIMVGDSHVMLADEFPGAGAKSPQSLGGTTCSLFLYVKDVDATFAKAVAAGAEGAMPPADQFWGDRFGKVIDPFGHEWSMATHIEDVAPEDMQKRADAFFAQMATRSAGS